MSDFPEIPAQPRKRSLLGLIKKSKKAENSENHSTKFCSCTSPSENTEALKCAKCKRDLKPLMAVLKIKRVAIINIDESISEFFCVFQLEGVERRMLTAKGGSGLWTTSIALNISDVYGKLIFQIFDSVSDSVFALLEIPLESFGTKPRYIFTMESGKPIKPASKEMYTLLSFDSNEEFIANVQALDRRRDKACYIVIDASMYSKNPISTLYVPVKIVQEDAESHVNTPLHFVEIERKMTAAAILRQIWTIFHLFDTNSSLKRSKLYLYRNNEERLLKDDDIPDLNFSKDNISGIPEKFTTTIDSYFILKISYLPVLRRTFTNSMTEENRHSLSHLKKTKETSEKIENVKIDLENINEIFKELEIDSLNPTEVKDTVQESGSPNCISRQTQTPDFQDIETIKSLKKEIEYFEFIKKGMEKDTLEVKQKLCESEELRIELEKKVYKKELELSKMMYKLEQEDSIQSQKKNDCLLDQLTLSNTKSNSTGHLNESADSIKTLQKVVPSISTLDISSPNGILRKDSTSSSTQKRIRFEKLVVLQDAALSGNTGEVRHQIENGLHVDSCNDEGVTAFHCAACNGHLDLLEYLVSVNGNINASDIDGWQPLHGAACLGDLKVVKFLVANGADIEARNGQGETPDVLAEDKGVIDLLKLYKKLKYSKEVVVAIYDFEGNSSLDELSMKKGDALQILERGEEELWWKARKIDSELVGYIPVTHVQ